MKIYLASSWRNPLQPSTVALLREFGHEVYDFRNPGGKTGFARHQCGISPVMSIEGYLTALESKRAAEGFTSDKEALDACDACVLLLPCGRSAHLEAGYAVGQGKKVYVLLNETGFEPELMYLLCNGIFTSIEQLLETLQA